MRNFIRLYLKDYVVKILSVPLFFAVKLLQLLLSVFSVFYGFLKYPITGFCLLGIIVELTCSPIRYDLILFFAGTGVFFLCFRYLEPFMFSLMTNCSEGLKNQIHRTVYLKSKRKFRF